jgi:hypothetical protein
MISTRLGLLGALSCGLPCAVPGAPQAAFELHDHAALVRVASALAAEHPELVRVSTLAQSRGGRALIALRLSGHAEAPAGTPAILLVAGLDGPRAYTSSLALHHARELVARYGSDVAVTELLDSTTLYIVPRLDVDACEARFRSPLAEVLGTGHGVDNDRDGHQGEDAASDVDGDGYVAWMRVPDPEGTWIEDPTDPRALIEADRKKGERGQWKLLPEGLDSDGDDAVAEDPALDAVVNRNFPRLWEEHAPAAGQYATAEPGALGLVEFLTSHGDIALVVTYGEEGKLVEKPAVQDDDGAPGGAEKSGVYDSDLALYERLGERYRKLTGSETEGLAEQPGSFQGFAYHHRGLACLDIDPWSVPLDAELEGTSEVEASEAESSETAKGEQAERPEDEVQEDEPKPGDDAKRLIWLDQHRERPFLPWTEFEHPQLGKLEIGGFVPYSRIEPPAELLAELAGQHLDFLVSLGADLARLTLVEVEGEALGGGLYEVHAALENPALLPQSTRAAELCRAIRPARVRLLLPAGAELLGGRTHELVERLAGSGGRREFRWLVGGVDDLSALQVSFDTDNAGAQSVAVQEEVK